MENKVEKLPINLARDKYLNSLLYLKKDAEKDKTKQRPYLCITAFYNSAGVIYEYLLVPITSSTSVGERNLVQISHEKLKKDSYCKLNNILVVSRKDIENYECIKQKFERTVVKEVLNSLKELL